MFEDDEQSHYMYENTGIDDARPDEKADVDVDMTCIWGELARS
jgi:hypothetical protein